MSNKRELHDILFFTREGALMQLEVEREGRDVGEYRGPPVRRTREDSGYRKVDRVARLGSGGLTHGPAFATLPNKPDPATSQMSCYLINPENVRAATPWVATEWSAPEDGENDGLQLDLSEWAEDAFELLIAGPRGKVFFVYKSADHQKPKVDEVDLQREGEIWTQLRNGVVAGSVMYAHHPSGPTVVPIVNVTSLRPPCGRRAGRDGGDEHEGERP